jgi:hypothetical protein
LSRGFFLQRYFKHSCVARLLTIDLKVSKRLEIFDRQIDNKRTFVTAPSIALDAADEQLSIPVTLNEPFPATVALHLGAPFLF